MKKNDLIYSTDIIGDIKKEIAQTAIKEINAESYFKELYARMVDEAVLLIQELWRTNAKYKIRPKNVNEYIEVEAYKVFFISKDMKLYSRCGYYKVNPNTNKCCFFDVLTFPSQDLIEQYVNDVLSKLPEGTLYEVCTNDEYFGLRSKSYTFKLKISMK